mgnify:CR=1 FL=1
MITEFGEDSEEVSAVLVALGPAFLHLYGPEAALPVLEEALMRMEAARGKDDIALYTPLKFLGQVGGAGGVVGWLRRHSRCLLLCVAMWDGPGVW